MKSILYSIIANAIYLLVATDPVSAQVEDSVIQKYLDGYISTGDPALIEKIRQEAPDSKYDRFCEAYELLDIDNEEGIIQSRNLINDFPDFPEAYFAFGTFLINGSKEYDSAITYLDRAVELKPDFTSAWFNRGIGKINAKNYSGAKTDFTRILEKNSDHTGALIMRATSSFMLLDYNGMLSDIQSAVKMDPYIISEYYFAPVIKTIDKSIELDPENVNLHYARGYANFTSGYFRLAIQDFQTAIRLYPLNHEFYKFLGVSKMYLSDQEGADYDLKFALDINPYDAEIYYYLGMNANDLMGQPDTSFEYLSRAIELDSLNPLYYYQRAWASYNLYDYEKALEDIEKAFGLDSQNGDFYTLRALTLLDSGLETEYDYCEDFRNAEEFGTIYKVERYIKKFCEK